MYIRAREYVRAGEWERDIWGKSGKRRGGEFTVKPEKRGGTEEEGAPWSPPGGGERHDLLGIVRETCKKTKRKINK